VRAVDLYERDPDATAVRFGKQRARSDAGIARRAGSFEVGEVTRTDVSLAEQSWHAARSNLAVRRRFSSSAKALLRKLAVARNPGRLSPPPRLQACLIVSRQPKHWLCGKTPIILSVQHQVAAADLLVRSNESSLKPRFAARGYG